MDVQSMRTGPRLVVTFETEKRQSGIIEVDLSGLSTIDHGDITYQVKKLGDELKRLESSRQFSPARQGRGR